MTRADQARIEGAIAALAEQVKKMPADAALKAERDMLRAALVRLVGVDGRAALEKLEARLMFVPAEDKAIHALIDAIHALIATTEAP